MQGKQRLKQSWMLNILDTINASKYYLLPPLLHSNFQMSVPPRHEAVLPVHVVRRGVHDTQVKPAKDVREGRV